MKSLGGGTDRTRRINHRHILLHFMIPFLGPLAGVRGRGWTPITVALACILMSWDPAPTLAQRFDSVLGTFRGALPRRRRIGRTYQGFVKAMMRHGETAFDLLLPGRGSDTYPCQIFR